MVFLGSKNRLAKDLVPYIQKYIKDNKIEYFYDIFCGGANLADKINDCKVIANDLSPTVIALHKQMQSNPEGIPEFGSREWWDEAYIEYKRLLTLPIDKWELETKIPLWSIGAIEWYSSFSRGGFDKGYAKPCGGRDYYNEAYRNHLKQSKTKNYQNIIFTNTDYKDIIFKENSLIYCDPPYKNTRQYQINSINKFNYEEFYNWLRQISLKFPIFISEQNMPDDFIKIWEKDVVRDNSLKKKVPATEKLFFIYNGGNKNDL